MALTPIATVDIETTANVVGSVDEERLFSVSRTVPVAVLQIVLTSESTGRQHVTSIYFSVDDDYLTSGQIDLEDNSTTIGSINFARFQTGTQYKLSVYARNFDPDEAVSLSISLIAFETDLHNVTRDVLIEAEEDPATKAVTFGISEASVSSFLNVGGSSDRFEIGDNAHLHMIVTRPWWSHVPDGLPARPDVSFDAENEQIVATAPIQLNVRYHDDGFIRVAADVYAAITVTCVPAMVTSTNDVLQLQFRSASLVVGSAQFDIHDESEVLKGFPSIDAFREEMERVLEQLVETSGRFSTVLPTFVESRPLPDFWNRTENFELTFRRFDYRTVETQETDIGYLFLVFSVRSLMLPVPCFCEEEYRLIRAERQPSLFRKEGEVVTQVADSSLRQQSAMRVPATHLLADYDPIRTAAQAESFGVSCQSLQEIAKPYANMGDDDSVSRGGAVYASARFWFRTNLEDVDVHGDGISAVVDVTAEGSAKAAIRDRCGNDVASAGVRLRIRVDDTTARWRIELLGQPWDFEIVAKAVVNIGEIQVTFDHPGDPPPPLDRVDDWILTQAANWFRDRLGTVASERATLRFFKSTHENGGIRYGLVDDEYIAGEAAVLIGHLEAYQG